MSKHNLEISKLETLITIFKNKDSETAKAFNGFGELKHLHSYFGKKFFKQKLEIDRDLEYNYLKLYEVLKSLDKDIDKKIKQMLLIEGTQFYTPVDISERIAQKLYEDAEAKGIQVKRILEPSCGIGVMIDSLSKRFPNAEIVGIEKDFLTALISEIKYQDEPNIKIINTGFEDYSGELYDIVCSNIPFGNIKETYQYQDIGYIPIEPYFYLKGKDFLNDDGLMFYISGQGFFNAKSFDAYRNMYQSEMRIDNVEILPKRTFDNTEVTSVFMYSQKTKEVNIDITETIVQDLKYKDYENKLNLNTCFLRSGGIKALGSEPAQLSSNQYGKVVYVMNMINREILLNEIEQNLNIKGLSIASKQQEILEAAIQEEPSKALLPLKTLPIQKNEVLQLDLFSQKVLQNEINLMYYFDKNNISYDKKSIKLSSVIHNGNEYSPIFIIATFSELDKSGKTNYAIFDNRNEHHKCLVVSAKNFYNTTVVIDNLFYGLRNHFDNSNSENLKELKFVDPYRRKLEEARFQLPIDTVLLSIKAKNEIKELEVISETENIHLPYESIKEYLNDEFYLSGKKMSVLEENMINKSIELHKQLILTRNERTTENRERLKSLYENLRIDLGNRFINSRQFQNLFDKYLWTKIIIELNSLELNFQGNYIPSGLMNTEAFRSIEPQNVKEWYDVMINRWGKMDIDWLQGVTNLSRNELLEELSDKIIENEATGEILIKNLVLRGNLYDRYEQYKDTNIGGFIMENIPKPLTLIEIDPKITEKWMGQEIMQEFAHYFFDDQKKSIKIEMMHESYRVTYNGSMPLKAMNEYYISSLGRDRNGIGVLEDAMKGVTKEFRYSITHSDGSKTFHIDNNAGERFKEIVRIMNFELKNFLLSLPKEKQEALEKKYNYVFNSMVSRIEKPNLLQVEGCNLEAIGVKELRESQIEGYRHIMDNFGGLVDHEVGIGKSIQICLVAHNMKYLGHISSEETVFVIEPKAVLPQIASDYMKLYPNDFIMYGGENLNQKNKIEFLERIINERPDVVFMTPENFQNIEPNPDIYTKYITSQIDEYKEILDKLYEDREFNKELIESINIKMIKKEERLESRLEKINASRTLPTFDKLNCGFIIVDEAHMFKNLPFETIHQRVRGLNTQEGSDRAIHLKLAIMDIQQRKGIDNFGAALYTATPISNSMTEAFTYMNMLIPGKLEEYGMSKFDTFSGTFFEKSIDLEVDMSGRAFNQVERFRTFDKIPECAKLYSFMAHYCDAKIAKIDRPEENRINIMIPLDKEMEFAQKKMGNFIKTGKYQILNETVVCSNPDKNNSWMLEAYTKMQKMTLYPPMENKKLPAGKSNKINYCVENVVKVYEESTAYKGTQMIFLDKGVPGSTNLNLYEILKNKLIDKGIKEEEILFIHQIPDKKKNEFYEKMNEGTIRVLISSRSKGGVGINVQRKMVAIHLVDITNRLMLDIQAVGRGVRQGNLIAKNYRNNQLDVYQYAVERSGDALVLGSNFIKYQMMNQIRQPSGIRKMSEGEGDNEFGIQQAAFIAEIMGDDAYLRKSKIEKELVVLRNQFEYFKKSTTKSKSELETFKTFLEKQIEKSEKLEAILKIMPEKKKDENGIPMSYEIQYVEKFYDIKKDKEGNVKLDENGNEIKVEIQPTRTNVGGLIQKFKLEYEMTLDDAKKEVIIGKINNLDIIVQFENNYIGLKVKDKESENYLGGISYYDINSVNNKNQYIGTRFNDMINNIENEISKTKSNIESSKEKIENLERFLSNNDFPQTKIDRIDQLEILSQEVDNYIRENFINKKSNEEVIDDNDIDFYESIGMDINELMEQKDTEKGNMR